MPQLIDTAPTFHGSGCENGLKGETCTLNSVIFSLKLQRCTPTHFVCEQQEAFTAELAMNLNVDVDQLGRVILVT